MTNPDLTSSLAERARGRCHSCSQQRSFDLPHRTIFFCRAYGTEMTQEERDAVRDCPRWAPFRPTDTFGRSRAASNPLIADLLAAEDHLFYGLKLHLDAFDLDLKTVLRLAQPGLGDLGWVDTLERRFEDDDMELTPLTQIVDELRAHHYDALCELLDQIQLKYTGGTDAAV